MGSRIFLMVLLVLVCSLAHFVDGLGGAFQGPRDFINACDGCVVSKGIGFQSYFPRCTCFFTCVLVMSPKLSSMASPYVSYKKCCGCGESFSKKLLTCVNYYDKRSDCFDDQSLGFNPCANLEDGKRIPREKPDSIIGPTSKFCSGFTECKNVSGTVVPDPQCCPAGDCFDPSTETCTEACDSAFCNALREEDQDDCQCEKTEAPASECQYVAMENSNVKFMHAQEMHTFTCPAGTCWDQELCTCVIANNTGYNDCEEYVDMEFDTDLNARDSRGAILYTNVHGNVTLEMGNALFFGSEEMGQLNVLGTANSWLSNDLVLHFQFTLLDVDEDGSSSNDAKKDPSDITEAEKSKDEIQCIVGNCKIVEQSSPQDEDTLAITIERDADSSGEEIHVHVEYQDRIFMNLPDSMEELDLEVEGTFELEILYDFWLICCGSEEVVYAGVLEGEEGVAAKEAEVEGSIQILDSQTGFVFGDCERGQAFEGALAEVEIYKNCKPEDDEDYQEALEEILDELPVIPN